MSARFQIFGVPLIGTVLMVDAQRYEAIAVEPYHRKGGGNSFLITWRSICPDCAQPFDQLTGTAGTSPRRRCVGCRLPPTEQRAVSGKRWQAVKIEVRYPGGPATSEGVE